MPVRGSFDTHALPSIGPFLTILIAVERRGENYLRYMHSETMKSNSAVSAPVNTTQL